MATTHPAATRNSLAAHWASLANGGAGSTTLTIHAANDAVLVSINLADFGTSGAVATSVSTGNSGVAGAGGTASYARINDGDGTERARGGVGVGSGEFQISSTTIALNDTISLTANPSWTAPA